MANLDVTRDIYAGHIDDSVVPGTVHLVDIDHNVQSKHSKNHKDIILVPTPSDDPGELSGKVTTSTFTKD